MTSPSTSVMFDMRAPPFGAPAPELYAAALEMAAFADRIGVGRVSMMEHHGSEDGYLPQPFVMGGGVAAVTKRCRVALGAVILPLHDPVMVAEQIGVLDLMSQGRLEVILGAGYVESEFAAFGAQLRDRARRMDEGIDIILRALHGERFEAGGRPIFVRPLPMQRPQDILVVGGGVEASARRAARFGLGFTPRRGGLFELYDAECRRHGREPGRKHTGGTVGNIHLSRDPDATWARVLPHVQHQVAEYARWANADPSANGPYHGLLTDSDALRKASIFVVWTPEELIARAAEACGSHGGLSFMPLIGGLPPEIGWESLELLEQVLPQLAPATSQTADPATASERD